MQDKVLEFIRRRFKDNCKWIDGNCYYFAVILKDRFPEGKIHYDVINGHFVFGYEHFGYQHKSRGWSFYDWKGFVDPNSCVLVEWDKFDMYDSLEKERIIRDCIL